MKRASAPGKAILFGEHSVVYPAPCLPNTSCHHSISFAVNKRAYAEVEKNESGKINIISDKYGKYEIETEQAMDLCELFHEVYKDKTENRKKKLLMLNEGWYSPIELILGLAISETKLNNSIGFDVKLKSEIGRHLGSSTAIAEAVAGAALAELRGSLEIKDADREEISYFAYLADSIVSGAPSSTDNNVIAYGGLIRCDKFDPILPGKISRIDFIDSLDLVVADSRVLSDSGEMIKRFRASLEEDLSKLKYLDRINELAVEGLVYLRENNLRDFGKAMNENHEILQNFGVSHPKLDEIVSIFNKYGFGGKLTGAGGGGCAIGVSENPDELIKKLNQEGYSAFITKLNNEGIRLEN